MRKQIVWVTGLVLLIICLGGCQLAQEDLGESSTGRDRFIGIYVTFAPLGSDRKYAVIGSRQYEGHETATYEFDVPGIALLQELVKVEGDPEDYWITTTGEGMMDVHVSLFCKDDSEETELYGKLYLYESKILYVNPVYYSPTDGVYMLAGMGYGGMTKLSTSESLDSEEEKYSLKVTLDIESVEEPVQDVIKEFDSNDKVIKTTVITPDNIPDAIKLHPDCAYVIAEVHSSSEGLKIVRTFLDIQEGYYYYKYPGGRGFLICKPIEISKGN